METIVLKLMHVLSREFAHVRYKASTINLRGELFFDNGHVHLLVLEISPAVRQRKLTNSKIIASYDSNCALGGTPIILVVSR